MMGVVADAEGQKLYKGEIAGSAEEAEKLGQGLAERLLREGAEEVLFLTEKIRTHGSP